MIPIMLDFKGNEEQFKAIASDSKRILCLAGAGTGKTYTLTNRIANLNANRISCYNMLALTFTRLAGKEMKERVIGIVGKREGSKLFCNTFHAFCADVIREHGHLFGFDEGFSIYDEEDTKAIIQDIIKEYKYKNAKVEDVLALLRDPLEVVNDVYSDDTYSVHEEFIWCLERNNALDFDSLVKYATDILLDVEIQQEYRDRYKYVFIDEFQDTNNEQWKLIQLLNPEYLFCVGDDFQAIYGWRGANIDIIMGLSTDPDWEVIKLETNYRSVSCIIDASNKLISHNKQTQKILRAAREIEGDIMTLTFEDDITEAERVVKSTQIFQGYSDIAVLARTNAQLDKLKNMFDACDVPCVVLSNKDDVFKKGHIKSLLSVFNVCMNPKDDYSFYSAINFPERRLTDMQLTELKLKSTMKETSLFSTLTYTDFNKEILDIFDKVNKIDPFAVFTASGVYWVIVDMLNLISLYSNSGLGNRVTDLYEVGEKIEDWEQSQLKTGDSVDPHAFLKWLKLKDIQEKLVKKSDAVKLMTVHGSKGLEFEIVYVIGLNEDLFPSSKGDIEEERRLMYVAMTRAKDCLYLSSTATRNCNGQLLFCSPSRFLKELK